MIEFISILIFIMLVCIWWELRASLSEILFYVKSIRYDQYDLRNE
jgi:hypothetical protein